MATFTSSPRKVYQPAGCRLCWTVKNDAKSYTCIFKNAKSSKNKDYPKKILELLQIDLSWDETKDAKMCHVCQKRIDQWWDFRY